MNPQETFHVDNVKYIIIKSEENIIPTKSEPNGGPWPELLVSSINRTILSICLKVLP